MPRMQMRNIQWIPMIASVGIGVACYSMMTGKGGQLQSLFPMLQTMMGQGQQQGAMGGQPSHQGKPQSPGAMSQIAQQSQKNQQQQNQPSVH